MEPWRARLEKTDVEAAWNLFITRYRRVIMATIRRMVDADDVGDAFRHVSAALSADGLARLLRYRGDSPDRARFSTWLVTVVHNLVVDWIRQRDGRRRVRVPEGLSSLQEQIFTSVFVEQRSHTETYEVLCTSEDGDTPFNQFLQDLAETYRVVERARPRGVMYYFAAPSPLPPVEADAERRAVLSELGRLLSPALSTLDEDERAALQLFVVEGMPAADVARALGWPNAKAVYNRVYRSLKAVRAALERKGLGREEI